MPDYIENVRKYRKDAREETVQEIVNYLGIALRSGRDAQLVSCSDENELKTVRENWCKKKLGVDMPDEEIDAILNEVCTEMAPEKGNKQRVTFYYLVADRLDKLATL